MKKLALAAILVLAPTVALADDFWKIVGGVVVGGVVLDEIRDRRNRDREEVYYLEPPPMVKVVRCHKELYLDHPNRHRRRWQTVCYEDYVPAYRY